MSKKDGPLVADFKWNIWAVDDEGQMKSWVGMIKDPTTAFSWFKQMDLDPSQFRVNNIPPAGKVPHMREVFALSKDEVREGATIKLRTFEDRNKPQKRVQPRRGQQPRQRIAKKQATVRLPDNSPEMQKMRADAKELLDQHKADEAAEIRESEK